MMQFLMSRLQASAISWSSFSACRNSRGLPTETARVKRCTCSIRSICFSMACLSTGSSVTENEQRFRDLPEGLQRPIEGVLFRVRVEPAKQVRGRHFLEFDGCDHAQDFVPLLNHNLVIRIASGLDLPGGTVYPLAVPENIEPLALEVLEAGRVGKSQQMA